MAAEPVAVTTLALFNPAPLPEAHKAQAVEELTAEQANAIVLAAIMEQDAKGANAPPSPKQLGYLRRLGPLRPWSRWCAPCARHRLSSRASRWRREEAG